MENRTKPSARAKKKKRILDRQRRRESTKTTGTPAVVSQALSHLQAGRLCEARDLCCEFLERDGGHFDVWHVLGLVLNQADEPRAAAQAFETALALGDPNPALLSNLGAVHATLDDRVSAVRYYRQALEREPIFPEASNNLGNALRDLGHLNDAKACYLAALKTRPDYAEAMNNLGTVLEKQGRREEAMAHYREAIRLKPHYVSALNNLGSSLLHEDQVAEAVECCQRAIQLQPDVAQSYNNLGFAFASRGEMPAAIHHLRLATQRDASFAGNYLFTLSSDPSVSAGQLLREHRQFGEALEASVEPLAHSNAAVPSRRLRVGYVSPDLRTHVVSAYIEPILSRHNKELFEVYCYAEVVVSDATTRRLQTLADHWRWTCGRGDAQVARTIQEDQIDILVDLAGHTAHNRLPVFAYKPAPVQVTWLGYPVTTGLSRVDYRITSDFLDPVGEDCFHTEALVRLKRGASFRTLPETGLPVAPLPASQSDRVTFGSLHRLNKISAATLDLWARVVSAVPDSRLLVFWPTLHGARATRLLEQFAARGISTNRVELRHEAGPDGYLSVYHEIDIGLDVFPWTGSTTTREAIWMGVVVLAHYGPRRSARGSAAVLHQIGLDECIARSPDEYVELAKQFAADVPYLADLRRGLRYRMEQEFGDADEFTRELESAYRTMWRAWCERKDDEQ